MRMPTSGSSVEAFDVSQNSASSTRPLTAEAYDKQRLDALYSRCVACCVHVSSVPGGDIFYWTCGLAALC